MSKTWDQLIAEGESLKIMEDRVEAEAGNVRWLWGDLALEVAPMGAGHAKTGALKKLEEYAEALDVSFSALREYRRVAEAWPDAMRVASQPWAVHQQIAAREDREDIISNPVDIRTGERTDRWTFRNMQRFLGQKPSPHYVAPPVTTEEKAEAAAALLSDPDVADAIVAEQGEALVNMRDAIDKRSDRYGIPPPAPVPLPFDDRCISWVMRLNSLMMEGAKLNAEADEHGHASDSATSHLAVLLYQRMSERQFDTEVRRLLEAEG